jgi:hypothetical protein
MNATTVTVYQVRYRNYDGTLHSGVNVYNQADAELALRSGPMGTTSHLTKSQLEG